MWFLNALVAHWQATWSGRVEAHWPNNANWPATPEGCPDFQLRSLATGRVATPLPPEGGATHTVLY